jgi:hypothetical protein
MLRRHRLPTAVAYHASVICLDVIVAMSVCGHFNRRGRRDRLREFAAYDEITIQVIGCKKPAVFTVCIRQSAFGLVS